MWPLSLYCSWSRSVTPDCCVLSLCRGDGPTCQRPPVSRTRRWVFLAIVGFLPRYAPLSCAHPLFWARKHSTDDYYVAGLQVYPHPDSCNHYYKCTNGSLTLETCGNGLLFNEATALRGTAASSSLLFTATYATPQIILPAFTLQRKFYWFILGIARPQSQFPHSRVCDRFIYSQDRSIHFSCSKIGRSIVGIYKSLIDTWMWKSGLWPHNSFSGNICFKFSVLDLCSVGWVRT